MAENGPYGVLTIAAGHMTRALRCTEPNRSICGRCVGKKFDPDHGGAARKCQRCRGQGYTTVGRTKR